MSITINASAILNNLTANNSYAFSSTKRIVKYNSDADETRQSASSLKHKLRSLKDIDTSDGPTVRTQNKIKSFVNTYNDLMSSASGITGSKKLTKYMDKMDSLFSEYEDSLKSLGITRTSTNKLKFDTTNFSDVTSTKLDAVFGEDEHFVSDSIKYAKAISSAAQQALNTPENVLGTTTISVSAGNTALAQSDQLLATATKNLYLTDYASVQAQTLVTYLKNYTEQYNNTLQNHTSADLNSTENGYLNAMKNATQNVKNQLLPVGITVTDDGTLSFDETAVSSENIENVKNLFGSSSSYGTIIKGYAEKLFSSLVQADSSDLNIDYYA